MDFRKEATLHVWPYVIPGMWYFVTAFRGYFLGLGPIAKVSSLGPLLSLIGSVETYPLPLRLKGYFIAIEGGGFSIAIQGGA